MTVSCIKQAGVRAAQMRRVPEMCNLILDWLGLEFLAPGDIIHLFRQLRKSRYKKSPIRILIPGRICLLILCSPSGILLFFQGCRKDHYRQIRARGFHRNLAGDSVECAMRKACRPGKLPNCGDGAELQHGPVKQNW